MMISRRLLTLGYLSRTTRNSRLASSRSWQSSNAVASPYQGSSSSSEISPKKSPGTELVFKAIGERKGGGPTVIEFIAAPGFSTGDHVHSKIEEIFYVVDGEFNLRSGE